MAKVIEGTAKNRNNVGMHLISPVGKRKMENAQEDASSKGFRFIYVHKKGSEKSIRADSKAKKTKRG